MSTSGAAIINAVVPPDFVAAFALKPPSSNRRTSSGVPKIIVSTQGSTLAGSVSGNVGGATRFAGSSA